MLCNLRVVLFGLLLFASPVFAEKPELTRVFPAGGQIGRTVSAEPIGKLGTGPVSVWCDRETITAKPSQDGKKLEITIGEDTPPGLCWLRVWNPEGSSPLIPFVVGRLPEVTEKEPNETLAQANSVDAEGTIINGRLAKSGELDTYKFSLKAGQTLVADLLAHGGLKSPMDAVMQLVSAEGFTLAHVDDSPGLDPKIVFQAPNSGEYFLRVFAFPETPNSSIRYAGGADYLYRLTVTTGPYLTRTQPLAITEGKANRVEIRGHNVIEASALEVTSTASFPKQLPMPATPLIALKSVEHASLIESENDLPTQPPFSITGVIKNSGERDSYTISAKKGERWTVTVESNALGFPLDPVLEITDHEGKSLNTQDDKARNVADVEYAWKVPADGDYQLHVTDRFQHGGDDYAYLLTVSSEKPAFTLTVPKDAYQLEKGKSLEIPVAIARENGFAETVSITAVGLPKGITVKPMTSEPKGDTAKQGKLVLTVTGKEAFHGPIWIEGAVGKTVVTAGNFTGGNTLPARHVWLTYEPKKSSN